MKIKEPEVPETNAANVIIYRWPGDLKPWPGNARVHNSKQVAKLKNSLQKFGFTSPVQVDEESVILCGHGRVPAAKEICDVKLRNGWVEGFLNELLAFPNGPTRRSGR
jgi:ParB/Sulfiredoxin domain